MQNNVYRKGLVIGIIILFVGASVIPSVSTDAEKISTNSDVNGKFVVKEGYAVFTDKTNVKPIFQNRGNILCVGGPGPGNYSSIQDAVDDANDGDIVFVFSDSSPYYENVAVDKYISLIGEDKNTTVIDANGADYGVYVFADGVIISGFTIQNSMGPDAAGIFIDGAGCTVTDNIITNNDNYGMYITSTSSDNLIYHNNFIDNTENAYDNNLTTVWDYEYPSGGNYWSDWTTPDDNHSTDQDASGFDFIVDYPYNVPGVGHEDRWPFTLPSGWEKPFFYSNTLLVQFHENVTNVEKNFTIDQYGTEIIDYLGFVDTFILSIIAPYQSELDTLYMFQDDAYVKTAALDMYTYSRHHLTHPNDQCYPKQWHLNNFGVNPGVPTGLIDADIDAPQAWEHLTDCSQDIYGNNFTIAIIDSGVDLDHPDIKGNLWTNPRDPLGDPDGDGNPDDDNNGVVDDIHGADFVDMDGSPDDDDGHGTHCAGIICAIGNNRIGVSGVCWTARLMVLRGNSGIRRGGGLSQFERSVNYILQQNNSGERVKVVSYSAGVSRDDIIDAERRRTGLTITAQRAEQIIRILDSRNIFNNSISRLNTAGILFVCSVGNNGQLIDRADAAGDYSDYPPKLLLPNIIAVAACDNQNRLAGFSSWGTTSVDIVAPGENVMSLAMHGAYVYNDSDGNSIVSVGDNRSGLIPALFSANSTVVADDGDIDLGLINFLANEKHDGANNIYDPGEHIYRDVDGDNNVSAGDIRLSHVYINGLLKYNQHSTVVGTDADNGTSLHSFTANERHIDFPANNMYDPGEPIYRDNDNNNDVSVGDTRLSDMETVHIPGDPPVAGDSDIGDCLHSFATKERFFDWVDGDGEYDFGEYIYNDIDDNMQVSTDDHRLTEIRVRVRGPGGWDTITYDRGTYVQAGHRDIGWPLTNFTHGEKYSLVTYMSGTSMATPNVAGSIAHFWCHFPWLSHLEVKDWILRKVDPRKTLMNTVVSGKWNDGRLRMICGFDFGDAPDPFTVPGQYPTILWDEASWGASHEDMGEEWLGWDTSPEYDANVEYPWDVDAWLLGISNLLPPRIPEDPHPVYQAGSIPDFDFYDDGVSLPLIVFRGGVYPIIFLIHTENPFINDTDLGRYDEYRSPKRDEKKIYINAYFDWNSDGDWDDGGEHLIKCPAKQCTWWGGPNMVCCYGINWPPPSKIAFRDTTFYVPADAADLIWVRVRLDYGEDVGLIWRYECGHPFNLGQVLHDTYSHAQFGEVEDYYLIILDKIKIIGEPQYDDGDTIWVTSETPFELIDTPPDYAPFIDNYYRLWYEDEWTGWIQYDDTPFYLDGEGDHQIEFYGEIMQTYDIFYENFDKESEDWTTVDNDGLGNTWEWSNTTPWWADPAMEGSFMVIDDSIGELPNNDMLISPTISCSMFSNTMLTFNGQFNSTGTEKLYVNVTTDNGETWMNAYTLTIDEAGMGPWTVDLMDIADGQIIQVGFNYDDENMMGYGAIISDIVITGEYITYSPPYYNFHYVDETPPVISDVTLTTSDPLDTDIGWENISCTVIDDGVGVDEVLLVLTYPDTSTVEIPMDKSGDTCYYNTTFSEAGYYTYYILAGDMLSNSATYTSEEFALPMNEDVDEGGRVHFMDLINVSGKYGQKCPGYPEPARWGWVRADVDNNGHVHFMDLVAVSGHYGQQWKP